MNAHTHPTSMLTDRRLLAGIAAALCLGEAASAFVISFPLAAVVFAAGFAAAAVWIRRGGLGGPVLLGALCLFEVADYPFWHRTDAAAWISQTAFAVVALAGLAAAASAIVGSRRSPRVTHSVR